MNNKGFTLIELLGTIIIVGILAGITVTSISVIMSNTKKKECKILANNIETAAQMYYEDCKYGNKITDDCNEVKIKTLVEYGFLKGDSSNNITNPIGDENIDEDTYITIKYNNNKFNFNINSNSVEKELCE